MALKIESLIHRLKSAYVSKKKIYEFIFPEDTMLKKDFEEFNIWIKWIIIYKI